MNQVYPARSKTWNLERAKVPGIDDRKSVHISNIDRLTIVDPRELSRCSKSKFLAARGIIFILGRDRQVGKRSRQSFYGARSRCIKIRSVYYSILNFNENYTP